MCNVKTGGQEASFFWCGGGAGGGFAGGCDGGAGGVGGFVYLFKGNLASA